MFNKLSEISKAQEDVRMFISDDTLPLSAQKIGIEIEMEGVSQTTFGLLTASGYWKHVVENSLRGEAGELVSVPVLGKDIDNALQHVVDVFKRIKKPIFNARTSIHIHMDVMDLDREELIRFVLLYCAFELILFRQCDATRQNNPYCLPIYMSENSKTTLASLFSHLAEKDGRSSRYVLQHWVKYNAMNLNNIPGIGTVEFRQLHGTIDKDVVMDWIRILMSIKKYAKESMESYNDFPEVVSGFIPHEYLENIFSPELVAKLYNHNTAEDLLVGIRCAQDILLYKRLQKSTSIIYSKQSGKEVSSYNRLMKSDLRPRKSPFNVKKPKKAHPLGGFTGIPNPWTVPGNSPSSFVLETPSLAQGLGAATPHLDDTGDF